MFFGNVSRSVKEKNENSAFVHLLRRPCRLLLSAFAPFIVVVSGVVACASVCVCQSFRPLSASALVVAVAAMLPSPSPVPVLCWLRLPVLPFHSQISISPNCHAPR
ncbi:uncharacterized protein HKW66_Vig0113630 [Vigna angularis]|uniref:Transmembrane protein n=1 Tax=Phaseolus angularis TaxID=3914 RepID=A0A8T0KYJ8_PHAAN|nr:uncharacterized protein HKW66_Vig0113630 [Vigna angularis]